MKASNILALTVMMICATSILAQKTPILKSQTTIPATSRKVNEYYIDKNTGNYTRFFLKDSKEKRIERGRLSGKIYTELQQGLILQNGNEVILSPGETIISTVENKLLSSVYDFSTDKIELLIYEITASRLSLLGKKMIDQTEGSYYLMNNGAVIISDEYELSGTSIEIVSYNLKTINTYNPFPFSGFSQGFYAYNNTGKITCLFKGSQNNEVKLVTFSAFSGKKLNEELVALTHFVESIQSFGSFTLVYGERKLSCLDVSGTILWSKSCVLPNHDFFNDGENSIFLFTMNDLLCVDAKTGFVKWQKSLNSLNQDAAFMTRYKRIRPISFKIENADINLILSETEEIITLSAQPKYNNYFIRLDSTGYIKERFFLSKEAKELSIKNTKGKLGIIQDQEILNYER